MAFRNALFAVAVVTLPALFTKPVSAQLTIVNPEHIEIPASQPEVLLQAAREVAAKEFHIKDKSEIDFPLILTLGRAPEVVTEREWEVIIDEAHGSLKLYMKTWDETKFAALAIRLCLQRLANSRRQMRLVKEVLAQAQKVAPVSARQLQARGLSGDKSRGEKPGTALRP